MVMEFFYCTVLYHISEQPQGPCDSNPCQNGGSCVESDRGTANESYTCQCGYSGYNGTNCEESKKLRQLHVVS